MKHLIFSILALFGISSMFGCMNKERQFTDLDVAEFADLISSGNVRIVDVRTPGEFSEGHIKDAVNIDVKSAGFFDDAKRELTPGIPVAVYCRSGKRSVDASEKLVKMGFKVYNLKGGILDWQKEGKTVVK